MSHNSSKHMHDLLLVFYSDKSLPININSIQNYYCMGNNVRGEAAFNFSFFNSHICSLSVYTANSSICDYLLHTIIELTN
jgi:hypothetical protein